MDVTSIFVAGIPVLFVVIGLVEAAKRLGVGGKGSLILALILGLVFSLAMQVVVVYPEASAWLQAVVIGLVLGLSATGIYDLGSKWATPKQQ